MPRPRNFWVLRGLRGANARQRLLDYYAGQLDIEDNVGQGGAKPARKVLYVEPFAFTLATDHVVKESAYETAWTTLPVGGAIASHVTDDATGKTPVNIKSYKAPRISRITIDPTGARAVSKITGLPYMKYDNSSLSLPFGKNLVADTIPGVYATLSAQWTDGTHKTRLIDERS